ncbi:MAG: hypothetical protein PVI35_08210, partial [Acidimicrobiia bacterium]
QSILALAANSGVDLVFNGHQHNLEVFAPMNAAGSFDPTGVRQIVAGTGGAPLAPFGTPAPNSEIRDAQHWGIVVVDYAYGNGYTMTAEFTDGTTLDLGYNVCN